MIVVDGIWSDWSSEIQCPNTDQSGQTYRTRKCSAQFGGTYCHGDSEDYNTVSNLACPGES